MQRWYSDTALIIDIQRYSHSPDPALGLPVSWISGTLSTMVPQHSECTSCKHLSYLGHRTSTSCVSGEQQPTSPTLPMTSSELSLIVKIMCTFMKDIPIDLNGFIKNNQQSFNYSFLPVYVNSLIKPRPITKDS